jgi:hypothetical protein
MRSLLPIAVVVSLAGPSLFAGDLFDGTWDIDVAASRYNPGPARTTDTRTYSSDGAAIRMVATATFADGHSESIEYTGAYDGKDYPVKGNPRVHTIAQVKLDDRTVRSTTKRDGKVTALGTRTVSEDGKTMTVTSKGTTEKGVEYDNTLVFKKRGGS